MMEPRIKNFHWRKNRPPLTQRSARLLKRRQVARTPRHPVNRLDCSRWRGCLPRVVCALKAFPLTGRLAVSRFALYSRRSRKAGIAQLVEQLICNQQVVGSNPTAGSK